jgi:glycosyltransferase involved in cell wall biosynthesis
MLRIPQGRPKILMVAPMPTPGTYIGGIAVLLSHLIEQWNLPYELVTYNSNVGARDYASVNRLNATNVRRFFTNAVGLQRAVRRERPHIVHFHTSRHLAMLKDLLLVAVLKASCKCKVVGHVHHASYPTLLVGGSSMGRAVQLRLLMTAFDRMILMSDSIKQELSRTLSPSGQQRFEAKARVLHNFAPLPDFHECSNGHAGPVTLFFIGNVGQQKGIHDLIEAAGELKRIGLGFRLVLAGPFDSPAEGERMRNRATILGLSDWIQFTGPVLGTQKSTLFRNADIFVLPSYSEGVPLSMLEAMSYRLPVVATRVGGIPEILAHGQMGLLIEPGNVTGLTAALRKLLLSTELRRKMGGAGRERAESFHSPARFQRALEGIYRELSEAPAPVSELALRASGTTQA